MSSHPQIQDIARFLEAWAPRPSAESYDNVGLQVGDPQRTVTKALVALDLTPAVIEEALTQKANLIITHHPVLFRPTKSITANTFIGSMLLRLAEERIALYCIHTNLDNARHGVSFALAKVLGLEDIHFLEGKAETQYKLVVFASASWGKAVLDLLKQAQLAPAYQSPEAFGETLRIAVNINRWALNGIVDKLQAHIPASQMHYDVYPVLQKHPHIGLGTVGRLPKPEPLPVFLDRVATRLQAEALRYVGDSKQVIERVATCGGSGSSFIGQALAAGADAYVTADVTYHTWFNVFDPKGMPQMALVDPGHYESEAMTETLLTDRLRSTFPQVVWQRTSVKTNPMKTYIPRHAL